MFRANPLNIGVESELYTRFADDETKDVSIEEWFAETIDSPATAMIRHFLDPAHIKRKPFRGDSTKSGTIRQLGFKVNDYVDEITLPTEIRKAVAAYVAALLVRHPSYLEKLVRFHREESADQRAAKNHALDNMLWLHGIYKEQIRSAVLVMSRRAGASEFIYADGGIKVEEPWRKTHGIPFDIHAPLTPDIAVQVLPLPFDRDLSTAPIMECTNQGVARQNRIVLGVADRFVFTRQAPPIKFIVENFAKPAPKNIGYRVMNGRLETKYDPTRK